MAAALARGVLVLTALLFAVAGASFALAPELLARIGIELRTPAALNDVRAVYGGLELGVAAVLGHCALRASRVEAGLWIAVATLGGMNAARVLSVPLDGAPQGTVVTAWAGEAVALAAAAAALLVLRRAEPARAAAAGWSDS